MIGIVLGPLAETSMRSALLSSNGDYAVFVDSPITITLYILLAVALLITAISRIRARAKADV
jgi:putative tricarboxylic transport membrane protein